MIIDQFNSEIDKFLIDSIRMPVHLVKIFYNFTIRKKKCSAKMIDYIVIKT